MFGYFFSPISLIKKKNCDPHHFNMAVTTLVPLVFKNEHNKPYFKLMNQRGSHHSLRNLRLAEQLTLKNEWKQQKCMKKLQSLSQISNTSTPGCYKSVWSKWTSWRTLRQIELFCCCKLMINFSSAFVGIPYIKLV